MKKLRTTETAHPNLNQGITGLLNWMDSQGIYFEFKLKDIMEERGLTVRQVARLTGLRVATVHDFIHGKKSTFNIQHILTLLFVLRIENLTDLIDIHIPPELMKELKKDADSWKDTKKPPTNAQIMSLYIQGKYSKETADALKFLGEENF